MSRESFREGENGAIREQQEAERVPCLLHDMIGAAATSRMRSKRIKQDRHAPAITSYTLSFSESGCRGAFGAPKTSWLKVNLEGVDPALTPVKSINMHTIL